MVKLTISYVVRKLSRNSGQSKENEKKNLKKLTHLHLQDSFIDEIDDITKCKNLTVVYLQNNALTKIEHLEHAVHLTHLYMQKNKISKIENLNTLKKLRKLYLSHNCISVIEGLDQLCSLEELQVQKQELPLGTNLYFDPRTIKGLSRTLRTLHTGDNNLTSLVDLEGLLEIEWLSASNNKLTDIDGIVAVVSQWQYLSTLELVGNPICSLKKYREKIIANIASLEILDGKTVHETTRDFLKKFEKCKMEQHSVPQRTLSVPSPITDLTKNFNPGVRKYLTESLLQDNEMLISSDFEEHHSSNSMFPAWKTGFGSITPINSKVPRPFWRQVNVRNCKKKAKHEEEISTLPKL